MKSLVSTQWLATQLKNNANIVLLDASMDTVIGIEAIAYAEKTCIPNSIKMDVERCFVEANVAGIHPYPSENTVRQEAARLGIQTSDTIVIYDNQGVYASPRAWWILKSMGFSDCYILDGGLPKWQREGGSITNQHMEPQAGDIDLNVCFDPEWVWNAQRVLQNIETQSHLVIDARSMPRFLGKQSEPRPGVRSGHIPKSANLPFVEVLDGDRFKSPHLLKEYFIQLNQDNQPMVFSCGSGVTACILIVAAVTAGYDRLALYDGSWAEWGSSDYPIE